MPPMYLPPRTAPSKEDIWEHITTFTTPLPSHEGDCSICLESTAARAVRTRCGHVFHDACLAEWNAQASSCPYCRQELFAVRLYGVPFLEPIWISEEMFEEWRASPGGEEEVEGFWVREMGRWNLPAPVVTPPVVPQAEVEAVVEAVEAVEEEEEGQEEEWAPMTMEDVEWPEWWFNLALPRGYTSVV